MKQWWEVESQQLPGSVPTVIAVAYYRHSAQDRQENSIPIQRDQVREWATKNGVEIRSLLTLDDPESEFLQSELKDLQGQLKSLDESIRQIETRPATEADLEAVTSALQRLDPIYEVLYPQEQRRVLELRVEIIDVGSTTVDVQFRAHGIEQIVTELEPMGNRNEPTGTQ